MNYSNGITEEKTDNKKISDLTSKEHIQSLIFIQKLKGHSFDKYFIDRIDNEISRTMKKLENRNIK
jgi:archaellum component FlaD/FlaE